LSPATFSISRHFDAIEVIEAESQTVLNILIEHDFQDTVNNNRSAGNGHTREKDCFEGDGGQWAQNYFFLPDGSASPRNYGLLSALLGRLRNYSVFHWLFNPCTCRITKSATKSPLSTLFYGNDAA
jgi:hypothetical protein